MKKEKKGKVWIAGAGPGDAGLLTVRTAHLMRQADVIVYDALISAEIKPDSAGYQDHLCGEAVGPSSCSSGRD